MEAWEAGRTPAVQVGAQMIYFNHNATGPLMAEARVAWLDAVDRFVGNPLSPHRVGSRADAALDDARGRLGGLIGCDPLDVVWTSGATEANNQVFHHFARALPEGEEVWISAIEHPSVVESARHYFEGRVRMIPARRDGTMLNGGSFGNGACSASPENPAEKPAF
jgi:cysteine desulfurase